MTGQPEFADGMRGIGTFPAHWGFPEGRGNSEERASWILRNVATDQELKRRGLDPVEVRSGKRPRRRSAHEALARIAAMASEKL
jgi:hypothetical protein